MIPAWLDEAELCRQVCISAGTVDNWVAAGILPPPRKRGGKNMWKWAEVDELLPNGKPDTEAEQIRLRTKLALGAR
jgi:predicted site-specific integrase-resolvase